MASSEKGKKLSDLLVIELRNYLKQRQLDHIGTKAVLVERLQQAIISEGNDPNTYIFLNDKIVNTPVETVQDKEQTSDMNSPGLDENSNQVEEELFVPDVNSATEIEDAGPMDVDISFQPKAVVDKTSDKAEKTELEAEINESFVLMIDELISEKFLEEAQNEEIGEPDFVDTNDVKLDDIEKTEEDQLDIGGHEFEVDPLDVENEEEKLNSEEPLNSPKENEAEKRTHLENVCNKELIVVVHREDLLENKRKLLQASVDTENMLPHGVRIKQEIIELSDDETNSEENLNFNDVKPEPFENAENKTVESQMDNSTPNIEADQNKPEVIEQEQPANAETTESSLDKENSKTIPSTHNLNIENLISTVKAHELRLLFCNYAKVLEVKVFHDNKKNYCHAFAKVEVNNVDEMLEKLNGIEYKGTVISVTLANDKTNTTVTKEAQKIRSMKGLKRKRPEKEEKGEPKELDRNLWVTNLLQNTKAQDIKQLLSQHAKVIGVKVVKSSSDPSKNCYGYVTLESKSDVDLCIQKLDKTTYNGRVIRLSATKKAPVLDSVPDKIVKKSPEKDDKGSNNKTSDKKKTPDKNTKKSDDIKKDDDKKSDCKKETYEKSRSDRDRHQREKERIRFEEERMRQDVEHAREILRRQREEARQLDREREKIRKEREYLERQRSEILRLERERQRLEREKIEKEKEELRRQQQRLEEARRAEKRASSSGSSSIPSKRSYISPKRDKPKKTEMLDFPKRSNDFPKEKEDPMYSKRHGEYSKRIDEYSKRADNYPKRSSDYHKRVDDYLKRPEIHPRRVDDYPKRMTEEYPKRFDHYSKPDEMYVKEDCHKRTEFPNYSKREDRVARMDFKRDYSGHSSHHASNAANNSGYKFDTTYHPDRDKLIRAAPRKDLNTKDSKPIGYNDRAEISNTEAYRSFVRDDRDRERKSGVDYSYKNDNRLPLLKETPRFKDDGNSWTASAAPVKTLRDVDPNAPKDTWWRKWDGQWNTSTSTEYPGINYNSGTTCPPPPGINSYPINSHFGNYRKY